jgi:hypothetical protein
MYKLLSMNGKVFGVYKEENGVRISFSFDPANTDYANFKKEVLAGAELQDADGNVMTDAAEYVRTLP